MNHPYTAPVNDLAELVKKYATPLVIYSGDELNKRLATLQNTLPSGSRLLYSVKANPNPFVLKHFNRAGLGFEVASAGELQHVLKSGIDPGNMALGGPIKSKEAIALAISNRILSFNVESERDLQNIIQSSGHRVNISVRINPGFTNGDSMLKMGGLSSQFGVDENEVIPLIRKYRKFASINGLFMFTGSQYFDARNIIQNTRYLAEFAEKHKDEFDHLDFLDFGGGFGVSDQADPRELDMEELKSGLAGLFEMKREFLGTVRYKFFESGRYLTTTSATLVSSVLDVKYSKGKKYILLDTGINHLGIKLFDPARKLCIHTVKEYRQYSPAILTGASCTPLDIIQNETEFADVETGDLVMIRNVGAYTASLSPIIFAGSPILPKFLWMPAAGSV